MNNESRTVRMAIRIAIALLIVLAALDALVRHHRHFEHLGVHVDGWPLFYPIFGFLVCVLMVIFAKKVMGYLLSRDERYYDDD